MADDKSAQAKRRGPERQLDPKKGPKGDYRPVELCKVLSLLRRWREESARSQLLVR